MRHPHFHDATAGTSAQGREGLRERAQESGQEYTALIASMTLEGAMGVAMAVEGSIRAFVFEAYVERFLAPSLRPGQIVLMDNLGAHKTERVRDLIEERGCRVCFLPAYSPDLNPIEEAFNKVKAHLRKAAARTREALVEAMGEALSALTPQDAEEWFAHCGYGTQVQSS